MDKLKDFKYDRKQQPTGQFVLDKTALKAFTECCEQESLDKIL